MSYRALIALHGNDSAENLKSCLQSFGIESDITHNQEEAMTLARSNNHQLYAIEANLGFSMTSRIENMLAIYELVKSRVDLGLAKFVAISGTDSALEATKKRGIEAIDKLNLYRLRFDGLVKEVLALPQQ